MKHETIIDFIYEEAFLLDTMQWSKWLELYDQGCKILDAYGMEPN